MAFTYAGLINTQTWFDTFGKLLKNTALTLTAHGSMTLWNLYGASSRVPTLTQPLSTDADGNFALGNVYGDPGDVDVWRGTVYLGTFHIAPDIREFSGAAGPPGPTLNARGTYSGATAYAAFDEVNWPTTGPQGSYYAKAAPPVGTDPTNTTYWAKLADPGATGAASTVPGPPGAPAVNWRTPVTIQPSTAYAINDAVQDASGSWRCILAYTSAASPVVPSLDPTHWVYIVVPTTARPPVLVVAASNANAAYRAAADYICTGTNDHTTVNAALSALGGVNGGTVQLSDGTFNCGGSISRGSNQVLAGVGGAGSASGATKLVRSSGTAPVITNNGSAGTHVRGGGIRDLTIDCQNTAGPGIQCQYASTFLFWRVEVDNALGEGLQCVEVWDSTVFECRFNGCGSTNGTGTPAIGIYQNLPGVPSTDNCNNIRFYGCTCESFTDAAVKVIGAGTGSVLCFRIDFENCKFETVTGLKGGYVTADYVERLTFRDCLFVHGTFASGFSTPVDTIVMTHGVAPTVEGCMFEVQDVTRSLRSFVHLSTGTHQGWVANNDVECGGTNYPTVAAYDFSGSLGDNQLDCTDWTFDGHGGSTLFSGLPGGPSNSGTTIGRTHRTSHQHEAALIIDHASNAELVYSIGGVAKVEWNYYNPNNQLSLWDYVHSRSHIIHTPGASSAAATSEFAAQVQVDDKLTVQGDVDISTAGKGLRVAEGTNAKMGLATLAAGTVVVATTAVTANSRIFLTNNVAGGTPGFLRVSARTAGTSFTILSSSGTDTSQIAWMIVEPG